MASFYAQKFQGRKTATGEIFKQGKLTAASNVFKLGSVVKVTNLINNKTVNVLINDRMKKGIERRGRVIDLSLSAFKALETTKNLLHVKVQVI